jgi:topoisomerase-4 subunit B
LTFFWKEMRPLMADGRIYLAQPPLYRLSQGGKTVYAMDDAEKERLTKDFKGNAKIEVSRFKGLGEMPPAALKETTMDPRRRTLLKVLLPAEDRAKTAELVDSLMGKRPELRFRFIQERAATVEEAVIDA